MGDRLSQFAVHDAILLVRHSFALPRLLYLLHTSPAFLSPLSKYDAVLCSVLSDLLNVSINVESPCWTQASLPIRSGGLGIRSAVQFAPSCYLSSAAASNDLVSHILPNISLPSSLAFVDKAQSLWLSKFDSISLPSSDSIIHQKAWDEPQIQASFDHLLSSAEDDLALAWLNAVSAPESGAWLQALLISSLGLRLDDIAVQTGAALRLGLPVCVPHSCRLCGASVDSLGLHGLTCKRGNRRFHRHAAVSEVLHRALSSAGISSTLEPSGHSRSDGKQLDGMTLVPWERGKPLVWDATVPDSLATSYSSQAITATGAVAALAVTQGG
uniref:Uncharacterized protein n=1 Tax=Amphimedon queenslandica TaxID=400682 RepID=A0A1X7U8Q8_AMPQE